MIDVEQQLRNELDRWQPLVDVPRRWDDVLRRAGERPIRRPSRLVLIAAALVALVAVGTAYALVRHFRVGAPAPPDVKKEAASVSKPLPTKGELIPRIEHLAPDPGVIASKTRLAAKLEFSTGSVYLWVAPTKRGRLCLFTQVVGSEQRDGRPNLSQGSCPVREVPIDAQFSGTRLRSGRWLELAVGHVAGGIVRLEMTTDSQTLHVPLTGRFFLFRMPNGTMEGQRLELVAYDARGREVGRLKRPPLPDFNSPLDDIAGREPTLVIETRRTDRPIELYVFNRDGERCEVVASPGGTSGGCTGRRLRRDEILVTTEQIGSAPDGMLLVRGPVGAGIARLELRFEDGRAERLPLARGHTIYQVAHRDYVAGRRPIQLIGRDSAGHVVARKALGPWRG